MSIRQLPSARWTVPGTSGGIAANWYVYTYQPGTSTPKSTYTDYTGGVANSNPIVLDARGEANIWWDGTYKVLVYTGDKDSGGVLVWSQDNYGEGTTSVLQGNFNLCLNGSFEQDTNGDNLPDNWACVAYSTGTVALDSTTQAHGAKSLKFTSVGAGGGYATSDKFEVSGSSVVPVSFYIISSVANVHNQVDIIWYTAAQAVISTTTLYNDSTTNPLTWTIERYTATSPATARYAAVRVYGCKDDNATAGSVWFDNVKAESQTEIASFFPNVNGNVTATDEELSFSAGVTGAIQTQLNSKTSNSSAAIVGGSVTGLTSLAISSGAIVAGTYTPVASDLVNASAVTPTNAQYQRIGNIVSVFGDLFVDPIAAGYVSWMLTLPIASNFTSTTDANGLVSASMATGGGEVGKVDADATADKFSCHYIAVNGNIETVKFCAMYQVKP